MRLSFVVVKHAGSYLLIFSCFLMCSLFAMMIFLPLIFNKDDQDKKVEMLMAPLKKQDMSLLHQETKQEGGLGKKKGLSKKQKAENGETGMHAF